MMSAAAQKGEGKLQSNSRREDVWLMVDPDWLMAGVNTSTKRDLALQTAGFVYTLVFFCLYVFLDKVQESRA